MTKRVLVLGLAALVATAGRTPSAEAAERRPARASSGARSPPRRRSCSLELQGRIESFQFGPENVELAQKIVAADRQFAHGRVLPLGGDAAAREPGAPRQGGGALEEGLRGRAALHRGDGRRPGQPGRAGCKDAIPLLEKIGAGLPERAAGAGAPRPDLPGPERARQGARRVRAGGRHRPSSLRVRAFLANDDLLKGDYEKAAPGLPRRGEGAAQGRRAVRGALRARLRLPLRGQGGPRARRAQDLPRRVQGQRRGAGLPRGLHLELDRPHQPRERPPRRRDEGLREGLRERARQQPARGPEAGLARPAAPRPLPHARADGQARGGVDARRRRSRR